MAAFDVLTASHAAVSSKDRVNPASCRAYRTAATTTPCSLQETRGASASRTQNIVPRSSARHRWRPSPRSSPRTAPSAVGAAIPLAEARPDRHYDRVVLVELDAPMTVFSNPSNRAHARMLTLRLRTPPAAPFHGVPGL